MAPALRRRNLRQEAAMKAMRERSAPPLPCGGFPVAVAYSVSSSIRLALWLRKSYVTGKMKYSVINWHIGFDLVDYDPLLVGRALASDLD